MKKLIIASAMVLMTGSAMAGSEGHTGQSQYGGLDYGADTVGGWDGYNGIGNPSDNGDGSSGGHSGAGEGYCGSVCGSQQSMNEGEYNETPGYAGGNNEEEGHTHYDGETGQLIQESADGNGHSYSMGS